MTSEPIDGNDYTRGGDGLRELECSGLLVAIDLSTDVFGSTDTVAVVRIHAVQHVPDLHTAIWNVGTTHVHLPPDDYARIMQNDGRCHRGAGDH